MDGALKYFTSYMAEIFHLAMDKKSARESVGTRGTQKAETSKPNTSVIHVSGVSFDRLCDHKNEKVTTKPENLYCKM